ncbi:MAG: peptidase papain [Fibrobacteres bacterium]|nr:peptidase papain [Fibrobacterota bacterium]
MKQGILVSIMIGGVLVPAFSQTPSPVRKQFGPVTAAKMTSIPNFVLPAMYKDRTAHPLPATADITKQKWMPPVGTWGINGWACANASAVSYAYTYEEQMAQNLATSGGTPKYTFEYTYHFLNSANESEGGDGWMFVEAFDILKATGGMATTDFGGMSWGNGFGGWTSGYAKYYNAMKVRASEYYKIDASLAGSDELIKQYLYDHADGSSAGGMLVFQMNSDDIDKHMTTVSGRRVISSMGNAGGHALDIVGYDDTFNGGSYLLVNSWGEGGGNDYFWAKYSLFKTGAGLANAQGTPVMFVNVKKNYSPMFALKVSITHNQRNNIAIMTGVAPSAAATTATKNMDYAGAFNFGGGPFPMMGIGQSSTIEIGLDVTDFVPLLTGSDARFFLHVISKGGAGTINSVTLMDYTSGTAKEIASTETNKTIAANATTTISIPWTGKVSTLVGGNGLSRTQGASDCFAQPGLAHRGGNPVRITMTGTGASQARLTVRDIDGRPIFSSASALNPASGSAAMSWEMKDSQGASVAPGIYFASIQLLQGSKVVKSGSAKISLID